MMLIESPIGGKDDENKKGLRVRLYVVCGAWLFIRAVYGGKGKAANGHEYLALLKAAGGYTVSEERLESMITGLLNPKSEGRSAAASKKVKVTGSKKLPLAKKQKTSAARSAAAGEQDSADVYVFTTENADGMEGYVLASPDMRIGNILAVVGGKTLEDEPEWFSNIIFDGLAAYTEHTIQEYESISEEEMQEALENQDLRSTAPPVNTTPGSGLEVEGGETGLIHHWYPDAAKVYLACWTWWDPFEAFVPVNWHQGNPYNYYVNRAKGSGTTEGNMDDYIAGCGPVAIGQIMAYHGWPLKCTLNVTIPNANLNINNYTYNWANMRNDFGGIGATDTITGGAKDIAVLMYQIGHKNHANATYNLGSTGVSQANVIKAFITMGYKSQAQQIALRRGRYEKLF